MELLDLTTSSEYGHHKIKTPYVNTSATNRSGHLRSSTVLIGACTAGPPGQHFDKRHFFCKLIQERLPVGHLVHHYGPQYEKKCPSCTEPDETTLHFIQCPGRTGWHQALLAELNHFHGENNTKQEFRFILTRALKSILQGSPTPNPEDFPSDYSLVEKQYQAGWKHLFQGRFVSEWRRSQEAHLETIPRRQKHHKGDTWITGIIRIIWKHIHINWTLRNDARHGNDNETREARLVDQAQREITAIYENKNKVLPRHRKYFYNNTTTHFEQEPTSRQLRQWINTWNPLIIHSVKEARKTNTQGNSSALDHFRRLTN
mmetsp:Transcript_19591/g.53954  ORF Transcript_19591/g.53954 Transcript_19591/m.53954 type:complete len:316 (+) Transcript_19591:360-1307(+)